MPNGRSYTFAYNNFAELTKVTYPTGGYTRYDYGLFTHWYHFSDGLGHTSADFREVTSRRQCRQTSGVGCAAPEDTTSYEPTVNGTITNNSAVNVVDPENNPTTHEFSSQDQQWTDDFFSPRELKRKIFQFFQGQTTLLRTIQTDYNPGLVDELLPIRVTTTLEDTGQVSKVEWDYDTYTALVAGAPTTKPIDNVTEQREFDYGLILVRKTVNTWLKVNPVNGQDYQSTLNTIHILDRKASEAIQAFENNFWVTKAQTQFEYDFYTEALTPSSAVQHDDSGFGIGYTTRGNLTATKRWRNTDGAFLTTRNQYDDAGNILKTTDPVGHLTTFSYNDSWAPTACPLGGSAKAYLTSTSNALGHVTSSTYNRCSGTVASTTDPNLQQTTFSYDTMGRLTVTNLPDTGQTTRIYNEGATPLSVAPTTKQSNNTLEDIKSKVEVDGLGRVIKTILESDPQGQVITDTTYDGLGRKKTVSNPYRPAAPGPTDGTTTFQYDALGRVTKVIPPDGSTFSNHIATSYVGNTTTVTDQAGKQRKSEVDALGRLIRVWEPNAAGSLVNETTYQYDVLDNLIQVDQKGGDSNPANWRTRTFVYNSLSQLTSATNPESGTITYTYDNDGNLQTKADQRPGPLTITYSYDAIHRLTGKSYSNGELGVSYLYDQLSFNGLAIENGKGRRTGMTDAAGSEAWSYDQMGRVVANVRTTTCNAPCSPVTLQFNYAYTLAGGLKSVKYPDTVQVDYTYNAAGQPISAVDDSGTIYATDAKYAPHGALCSVRQGASITATYTFNNRLQPDRMHVTTVGAPATPCSAPTQTANILDFTYGFNPGISNNGNVVQIVNNRDTNRTQSFTYDELNRIKTAEVPTAWGLSFVYDTWGNLLKQNVFKGSAPPLDVTVDSNNHISGFQYDAAGNLTSNGFQSGTYNAENQLASFQGTAYTYDGDGRRVNKANVRLYWYGPGGEVLLEMMGDTLNKYVYFGGRRIGWQRSSVSLGVAVRYYFADHLGSARVVTDAAGQILEESDFYPFGGENAITNTNPDPIPNTYKFTGQERDWESGLDYFGARHYASGLGRFLQPDPLNGYREIPQSLNKYSYVMNNPLRYIDTDGLASIDAIYVVGWYMRSYFTPVGPEIDAIPIVSARSAYNVGVRYAFVPNDQLSSGGILTYRRYKSQGIVEGRVEVTFGREERIVGVIEDKPVKEYIETKAYITFVDDFSTVYFKNTPWAHDQIARDNPGRVFRDTVRFNLSKLSNRQLSILDITARLSAAPQVSLEVVLSELRYEIQVEQARRDREEKQQNPKK